MSIVALTCAVETRPEAVSMTKSSDISRPLSEMSEPIMPTWMPWAGPPARPLEARRPGALGPGDERDPPGAATERPDVELLRARLDLHVLHRGVRQVAAEPRPDLAVVLHVEDAEVGGRVQRVVRLV